MIFFPLANLEKKLFWAMKKFVFIFNCSDRRICWKNWWNKLVKTSYEFIIYFSFYFLVTVHLINEMLYDEG